MRLNTRDAELEFRWQIFSGVFCCPGVPGALMDIAAGVFELLAECRFDSIFVTFALGERFERLKQELRNLPFAFMTSPLERLGPGVDGP